MESFWVVVWKLPSHNLYTQNGLKYLTLYGRGRKETSSTVDFDTDGGGRLKGRERSYKCKK